MYKKISSKNKKGVSIMVGYVLLVVFVIIIGGIVYQWLKTYVPQDSLECPDGSSLSINEAAFNSSDSKLEVSIRNDGRFDIAGYFIYATNESTQELPTIDLSFYLNDTQDPGFILGNSILFFEGESDIFSPGSEDTYIFDIPSDDLGEIYSIEIIPTRFQEVKGKIRFVSCSDARTGQIISEPTGEISKSIVFVSSTEQKGNLGGISGADALCAGWASSAGLTGTFVAWLSNSTTDAKDRIPTGIPFKRVDNELIANNRSDLIDGDLVAPISLNEEGAIPSETHVFTGTNTDGTKADDNCLDWSSDNNYDKNMRGKINQINGKWTNENTKECDHDSGIYCFQIS